MKLKQLFVILVAALVGAAGSVVAIIESATAGNGDYSPIQTANGWRYDVFLMQNKVSDRLTAQNDSDETIRVEYTDPTYGYQVLVVPPHTDGRTGAICANEAYQRTNLVTVTYNPDTATSVTGTGKFSSWDDSRMSQYTHELKRAKKALKRAKRHHHKAAAKRARRAIRASKRNLRELHAEYAYCASRRQ
jgi:hypothetical protein